jgi:arsenite methyltransferase
MAFDATLLLPWVQGVETRIERRDERGDCQYRHDGFESEDRPTAWWHDGLVPSAETDPDLKTAVRDVYSHIAAEPQSDHPFPVGYALALGIGYPAALLAQVPIEAVESFAGVSYIHGFAVISPTDVVLDLGCGAGLDTVVASTSAARVVGVDFSTTMLERAKRAAVQAGVGNVRFISGDAERIDLPDESVDVVLVNGLFNLNPSRAQIFRELARVTRRAGRVYAAELILQEGYEGAHSGDPSDWFS